MRHSTAFPLIMLGVLLARIPTAQAAPQWDRQFGHSGTVSGSIRDMVVYDDGTGSAVYASNTAAALDGTYAPSGVLRFNATDGKWEAITDGMLLGGFTSYGLALTVWDPDGPGSQRSVLVAAGPWATLSTIGTDVFTWDGTQITLLPGLPLSGSVLLERTASLAVHDFDGDGVDELYVWGSLETNDGGVGIARWDPATNSWLAVGSAQPVGQIVPSSSLVFDDGSGPALYITGRMDGGMQGVPGTTHIARWNGVTWSSVGGGLPTVEPAGKLVAFDDDGAGPHHAKLVTFSDSHAWMWDGSTWTSYPYPGCLAPTAAAVFNEPGGPALYMASVGCPANEAALFRFNGTSFVKLPGSGVGLDPSTSTALFTYLGVQDLGAGPQSIAAGVMTASGTQAGNFVAWNGAAWTDVGPGVPSQNRPQSIKDAIAADLDGGGPAPSQLVVCGASPQLAATWDGSVWTAINAGLPVDPFPLGGSTYGKSLAATSTGAVYMTVQDGTVPSDPPNFDSHVHTYLLTGASWTPLDGSTSGFGRDASLLVASVGGSDQLFAFGAFRRYNGSPLVGVVHWNGTAWHEIGGGLTPTAVPSGQEDAWFNTTAVAHDDGTGTKLFVSGIFTNAGAAATPSGVATWNGSTWADASSGLPPIGNVSGSHPPGFYKLFAADGRLFAVPHTSTDGDSIYRWNGAAWTSIGTLPVGIAQSDRSVLGHADLGQGDRAYFVGAFTLYSFDPQTFAWTDRTPDMGLFSAVGTGPSKLLRFDAHNEPGLCIVGGFTGVGGTLVAGDPVQNPFSGLSAKPSPGIARWFSAAPTCPADLDDGTGTGTTDGGIDINDLLYFLAGFESGSVAVDLDNGTGTGTPDGGVDINDLLFFLVHFEAGC